MASVSLAPFRQRAFRLMWIGALVSNIGTWMESVALGYYVAHTTGKASSAAIVTAAGFIPAALVGPIGSAMSDRLRRRKVLVIGSLTSSLIAAVIAVWVGTGNARPGGLAIVAFVAGTVSAFTFPSFQTTLPTLVPRDQLVAAVGLSNAQWNIGRVIGPAMAALAIAIGDIQLALWCNAASYLAVCAAVLLVQFHQPPGVHRPIFGALADGIRFARTTPAMRSMLVVMIATIFIASPFIAFVPLMATEVFGGGSGATSLLVTSQGIGAVTAAFTLGAVTNRWGLNRVMMAAVTALCPVLVLYGIAPRLWVAAITLVMIGLVYGYTFTSFASVSQQTAPDELRGRVLAVNTFVLGLMFPLGSLLQGQLADRAGLRWVTVGSGTVLFAIVGVIRFKRGRVGSPPWRRSQRKPLRTESALPSM
ncbi:N/A [soil metagenome]